MTTAKPQLLVLRATLRAIDPPIRRRLAVAEDLKLSQLHAVIQAAFGWEDCHLHEFEFGPERFGRPDYDEGFPADGRQMRDERKVTLADALAAQREFSYWYDFGDDWWHDVVLEAREPMPAGAPRAELRAGERSGPPEDCGGPFSYPDLLVALRDRKHPEYDRLKEWVGDFDPERFDLAKSARAVARAVAARKRSR